jgi:hypothetical protein
VEYVEAIDYLLGFVDRPVLVRVGDAEGHPGFVTLNGILGQGEPEIFAEADNPVSFFPVSDSGTIYIYRNDFVGASYDAEYERLTIWLGPVAVAVEPRG